MIKNISDGIVGICGVLALTFTPADISTWVSIICQAAITIATCGIMVYRLIRDRNNDKNDKEDKK